MTALRQTKQVSLRYLRVLYRQGAWIGITLTQPIIWLLLFGALLKAVTHIPGFHGSYIDYLTPGVIVMLAVSSAGWTGMGFIEDINSGVMDRMLVSPAWRGAFNLGAVAQAVISVVIQTVLVVALALALGAPAFGVLVGAGAWLLQRVVAVADRRVIVRAAEPGSRLGLNFIDAFARIWLLAAGIIVAGTAGSRHDGLAAALVIFAGYSVAFAVRIARGREAGPS